MYEIEFYETEDGKCPIWDFLEALRLKAPTNKDARIQHKQASILVILCELVDKGLITSVSPQ